MKTERKKRGDKEKRTLESLTNDFESFMMSGGDIKKAKNHNNVISKFLFDVPLDQVL